MSLKQKNLQNLNLTFWLDEKDNREAELLKLYLIVAEFLIRGFKTIGQS